METNTQPDVPMPTDAPLPNPYPTQSSVPLGVKILAILYYLISIMLIFAGIVLVFTLLSFINFSGFSFISPLIGSVAGITSLFSGVLILAWGVLNFVAGRGLWTGQQWGKFLAITISALYFIFGVIEVLKFGDYNYITYISLILNLFIVFYLLASQAIKNPFQNSSRAAVIVLPILAIAIYMPIGVSSFKEQIQAEDFVTGLQKEIQRTKQALEQSNMDCKFYKYTNYDEKNKPLNTQSGDGSYNNLTYKFQVTLPQAFTMQEFRGTNYCEDVFVFYKPESTNLDGQLMNISVKPVEGDFNYYFNKGFKYEKNAQMTEAQIAGQPAVKITREPYPTWSRVWYMVIYDSKIYTIFNTQNMTEDQLKTVVATFQFTK